MNTRILFLAYLAAIVIANLAVATFGPSVAVVTAFLLISLDLTTRDRLHDAWKGRGLWWRMAALIGGGSLLSYALNRNAGPIALASFVAFASAGACDAAVYHGLRERAWLVRVNGSNVVSAVVDSYVFIALAFGFPILWGIVVAQIAAKVIGGALWSIVLRRREARRV